MPTIAIYLALALAVTVGGWFTVSSLEQRGADKVLAQVERETSAAQIEAHEHRLRAQQTIDATQREKAAEVAARESELKELRDARGKDGSDPVVFDERWSAWLRGARDRPGDRSGGNQVAADPASRPR